MTDPAWYLRLNELIDEFVQQQQDDDDEFPETATDAVLLIGTQWLDNDGDRGGRVFLLPKNGSQPYYITRGLLAAGCANIDKAAGS